MNGYNFLSSFGDSGKVLHLPLSGFSFVLCKKKNHWEMPGLLKMFLLQKKRLSKKVSDISPQKNSWLNKSIQSIQET